MATNRCVLQNTCKFRPFVFHCVILCCVSGASDAEKTGAGQVAAELGVPSPKTIVEGRESGPFWDDLGGKAAYANEPRSEVSDSILFCKIFFPCCNLHQLLYCFNLLDYNFFVVTASCFFASSCLNPLKYFFGFRVLVTFTLN